MLQVNSLSVNASVSLYKVLNIAVWPMQQVHRFLWYALGFGGHEVFVHRRFVRLQDERVHGGPVGQVLHDVG